MSTAAAQRKAKSRQREADGRVLLSIEVNAAELEALLVHAGCLDGMTEPTRAALAHGVEQLLGLLCAARDAECGGNVLQ